jgi:tripartite-type tricarboxylate transporter receptor subunit TctC
MGTLPGGRLDLIGRAVLSELETQLKQQVRARGQA